MSNLANHTPITKYTHAPEMDYDNRPPGSEPPELPVLPRYATRVKHRNGGEWKMHQTIGQAKSAITMRRRASHHAELWFLRDDNTWERLD